MCFKTTFRLNGLILLLAFSTLYMAGCSKDDPPPPEVEWELVFQDDF